MSAIDNQSVFNDSTKWLVTPFISYLVLYTYIDSIKKFADALHEDLLDVLVEVAIQDGVGAGGRQANQVTDHVGSHQAF